MLRTNSAFLIPALCLLAAGCGSSSSASNPTPLPRGNVYNPGTAKVAACAHAGKPIDLPATFPKYFPFPPGTVIDSTKPLLKGQIGIYGYVPSSGFASTVNFFRSNVPKAGFKLLGFEVDSPNDSEGTYQGFQKIGRWQLRSLPGCPQAMAFAASAERSK